MFENTNAPDWIKYNLPDFLWVFSSTSLLSLIWNGKLNKRSIPFVIVPVFLGVFSEILQQQAIIKGTFDLLDLFAYIAGFVTSVFLTAKKS